MPGILVATESENYNTRFWTAVSAEFLGVLLFAFFGGAAAPGLAAAANGIALAVLGAT